MGKSDEGEFELVLGNRQLLSFFFVVVVLLSVSFTVGYVVGRNSSPSELGTRQNEPLPEVRPAEDREPVPALHPTADPPPVETTSASSRDSQPSMTVIPSRSAARQVEAAPPTGTITQPLPGQRYLQVIALARPEAEVLSEVLNKKGFRSVVAPGPDEKLFRVLVGPGRDDAELARLKGELEHAGFKGAFPKRY
ncbi:MAG TPA: SPOR domain-containing protein [Beijerinckiaceae bacterium]|nr:SPOR domain-containing protein [Beijerinckiaceae bacterium]